MSKLEVAFFDFDKTLIPFSSGKYLIKAFLKIKQISYYRAFYLFVMEIAYRFGYLDIQSVMNESIKFLEGMRQDELKIILEDIYSQHIKYKLHPEAAKAISEHKKAGRKIIIVSNNLNIFLTQTIDDWQVDEIVANEILMDEGITRGRYTKKLCYGPGKIDRIKELPFLIKLISLEVTFIQILVTTFRC